MEKKVLIVGSKNLSIGQIIKDLEGEEATVLFLPRNITTEGIETFLERRGVLHPKGAIILEPGESKRELKEEDLAILTSMRNEAKQRFLEEQELMLSELPDPHICDFKNYEKELSQQGWKKRNKYRR